MKGLLLLIFWSPRFLSFSPLLPIIQDEFALSHAMTGSFLSFLSVGYMITLVLGGFLSSIIGYKRTTSVDFLIMMMALFLLKGARAYPHLAILLLVIGFGTGIYDPSIVPLMTATF